MNEKEEGKYQTEEMPRELENERLRPNPINVTLILKDGKVKGLVSPVPINLFVVDDAQEVPIPAGSYYICYP